tara:strand:- start:325 stop:450 length:126 start_codon:yes stop_codon:yes gene_type:complete
VAGHDIWMQKAHASDRVAVIAVENRVRLNGTGSEKARGVGE